MAKVVLCGYATVDYVMTSAEPPRGPGSHLVAIAGAQDWPRAGGAPFYAGRRLAAHGHEAAPLVSIGSDPNGAAYLNACAAAGLSGALIDRQTGARTPCCMLIHHAQGDTTAFIDPGPAPCPLSPEQREAIGAAEAIVVAAGDPDRTGQVLDLVRPEQLLAWVVKGDPASVPPPLGTRLAARADIVFCNAGERSFVAAHEPAGVRASRILVETRGADGLSLETGDGRVHLPARKVSVGDTTGAGDSFAGEMLAHYLDGRDAAAACTRALDAVSLFLETRAAGQA